MADRIAVLDRGRVVQLDAPEVHYERPRRLFVADFIGTNNILDGTVMADGLEVTGLGILPVATAGVAVGTAARLAIRPEHTTLTDGPAVLVGRVLDTQFYGGQSTITVTVDGYPAPILVTRQGAGRLPLGSDVRLGWERDRAVLLLE
jgi:spermidine/putrescine transport system ATP-binding protein/putrescine transport system ATP-binding protein